MGLLTSHGCWAGSYSNFHLWRRQLAHLVGLELDEMEGYEGTRAWEDLESDILHVLLDHPDNEGEIAAEHCGPLADRLETLLERLPPDTEYGEDGSMPDEGPLPDARERTKQFIQGLRQASERGEPVEFY
jgi:hypothetical protein